MTSADDTTGRGPEDPTYDRDRELSDLAEQLELSRAKVRRLEALLARNTTELQRRLLQAGKAQRAQRAVAEELEKVRRQLRRTREDRDALRNRRAIRIADRLGGLGRSTTAVLGSRQHGQ